MELNFQTMDRRNFIRTSSVVAGAIVITEPSVLASFRTPEEETWFNRPMRWAQLTLVENDPGRFDPDFWLSYFKRIHADGTTLSAGGVVAYYPTVTYHSTTVATGLATLILLGISWRELVN